MWALPIVVLHLSEHGLKARERFLDGVEVGAVGGRKRRVAPAPSIRSRTATRLWLDRLFMITMSLGRSSGTSTMLYMGFEPVAVGRPVQRPSALPSRSSAGLQSRWSFYEIVGKAHPQALALTQQPCCGSSSHEQSSGSSMVVPTTGAGALLLFGERRSPSRPFLH